MKFDSRTKVLITAIFSTAAIILNDPIKLLFVLLASAAAVRIVGVNPLSGIRRLKELFYLFLTMAILQNIFAPRGTPILTLFGHPILFKTSLMNATSTVIRVTIIIVTGYLLIALGEREFIRAMGFFGVPNVILLMTIIGFRFIPIIRNEIRDMLNSLRLRGIEPNDMKLKERASFYLNLTVPLVFNTLKRARDIAAVLEARGFRSDNRRKVRFERFGLYDWVVITFSLAVTICIVAMP